MEQTTNQSKSLENLAGFSKYNFKKYATIAAIGLSLLLQGCEYFEATKKVNLNYAAMTEKEK